MSTHHRILVPLVLVALAAAQHDRAAAQEVIELPEITVQQSAGPVFDRQIHYKTAHLAKKVCGPTYTTLLTLKDPCVCGGYIEIPVDVPVTCTGQPKHVSRKGLLVAGVAYAKWCNGCIVKVVFSKCGDITVKSYFKS